MELHETFKLVSSNLRANPLRSFLTMLGLIIGIGSVVLIVSLGAGAQALIVAQVNSLGSNLVGVLPGASDDKGPPASVFGIQVKTLVNDDVKALLADSRTSHLTAVSGYAQGKAKMVYANQELEGGSFMGVEASYPQIEKITLTGGRFFSPEEDSGLARVAVIGSDVSQELWGGDDPLGKTFKIKRESFRVIGVLQPRGRVGFSNLDKYVLIPLSTAQKILLGWRHLSLIRGRVDEAANIGETIQGMKEVLRDQHNIDTAAEDDFSVRNAADAVELLKTITDAFRFFLAAIAAISLLVGGIGIMNIMLVAVTERYREIGLRKAVGATRRNIQNQFLIETLVITGLGSIIGIAGGAVVSALVTVIARALEYNWEFIVSLPSIFLAVGVGLAIGLAFGFYPARRAAQLDPIVALRYE
ncbi:MAG: ABC transporter permease [Candidatus Kerfeldbacteria bacterium]|nr:ABC transporter permease [Candidatus Kerfeldbacteria bacterium]